MEISSVNKAQLVASHLDGAIDYDTYRSLVFDLAEKGLSTAPEQTETNSNFTKLNASRMRRLDKTVKLEDEVKQAFENYKGEQTWLVITESWCGDAAQVIPVINKVAELSDNIDVKFVMRDTRPELMDAFLTDGTRSIPKLIAVDNSTGEIIDTWGPRPIEAQQLVLDYKAEHGSLTPEFKKDLQVWYNKDKGKTTAKDLLNLIS